MRGYKLVRRSKFQIPPHRYHVIRIERFAYEVKFVGFGLVLLKEFKPYGCANY